MDCLIFIHAGLNFPALTPTKKQYRLYYQKKKRYVHLHLCGAWRFLLVTVPAAETFRE